DINYLTEEPIQVTHMQQYDNQEFIQPVHKQLSNNQEFIQPVHEPSDKEFDNNNDFVIQVGAKFPNWKSLENALKKYETEKEFASSLCMFLQEVLDKIKFLTQECGFETKAQHQYITKKFSNQSLYNYDLYYAICQYKNQMGNQRENNAANMIKWLMEQKKQEP
ncbi:17169_t:CDS:2, partial [Cetraspora pellucida]